MQQLLELLPGASAPGGLNPAQGVVYPAPAISQGLGLGHSSGLLGIEELIHEPPVVDALERSSMDSAKPFCHGDPGSM